MNENPCIIPIVEGKGEKNAVPGLLRRILSDQLCRYDIRAEPSKTANGKPDLLKRFENFLNYAAIEGCAAILVLLDADLECPYEQVSSLAERAEALKLEVPVAIVYANSEYESWFISSLSESSGEAIRTRLGIAKSVNAPENVEDIQGAKAWLTQRMPNGRSYKETGDQEHLTYHININLTHNRSRSFRRLCHAVDELVNAIDQGSQVVTPSL